MNFSYVTHPTSCDYSAVEITKHYNYQDGLKQREQQHRKVKRLKISVSGHNYHDYLFIYM